MDIKCQVRSCTPNNCRGGSLLITLNLRDNTKGFMERFFRKLVLFWYQNWLFWRQNYLNCKITEKRIHNAKRTRVLQIDQIWTPYLIPILSNLKLLRSRFVVNFWTSNFCSFWVSWLHHHVSAIRPPQASHYKFSKLHWCPLLSNMIENSPSKDGTYLTFCLVYVKNFRNIPFILPTFQLPFGVQWQLCQGAF